MADILLLPAPLAKFHDHFVHVDMVNHLCDKSWNVANGQRLDSARDGHSAPRSGIVLVVGGAVEYPVAYLREGEKKMDRDSGLGC